MALFCLQTKIYPVEWEVLFREERLVERIRIERIVAKIKWTRWKRWHIYIGEKFCYFANILSYWFTQLILLIVSTTSFNKESCTSRHHRTGRIKRISSKLLITADGRCLELCIICRWPINVFILSIKKWSAVFLFFYSIVSAVVQTVDTWFIPRFVTWSQRKGVCITWRTLAFRRVYAGCYGLHAEEIQIVAQL